MSFGVYRPQMGVASGMRVLCSDQTLQEQRRVGEQNGRQAVKGGAFNPITGEAIGDRGLDAMVAMGDRVNQPGTSPGRVGRPPPGHLQPGLHPVSGPWDPITVPGKDVYGKKVDPTRNQSTSFIGGDGLCAPRSDAEARRVSSRLTSGHLEIGEAGLAVREATPERRMPGEVLRAHLRPKDHLTGGCITSDKPEHPLALPRKAGSGAPGTGSGGPVHLVAGPYGFMPAGPGMEPLPSSPETDSVQVEPTCYRSVWG